MPEPTRSRLGGRIRADRGLAVAILLAMLAAVLVATDGLGASSPPADPPHPPEEPFRRCATDDESARSGSAVLALETTRRAGESIHYRAALSWRRDSGETRLLLRMEAPEDLRGSAFLWIESDESPADARAFAYLPEIDAVRPLGRRRLRAPLFGTDITIDDLRRLRGLADGDAVDSYRETKLLGRPVWRIEGHASDDRDEGRLLGWLDRERCVLIRAELLDRKGRLKKVVRADPARVESHGGRWLTLELSIRDVREESLTRVDVLSIDLEDAPASLFEPEALGPAKAG